jgi:hypothetical protein
MRLKRETMTLSLAMRGAMDAREGRRNKWDNICEWSWFWHLQIIGPWLIETWSVPMTLRPSGGG